MRPADTSPAAFAHLIERYGEIGTAGRSRIAAELSDAVRETALAAIRRRHPEYSEADVARAFVKTVYQIDLDR
jgi:hypothetical protein